MDVKMKIENPKEVVCTIETSMSLKSWLQIEKDLMALNVSATGRELSRRIHNSVVAMQKVIEGEDVATGGE